LIKKFWMINILAFGHVLFFGFGYFILILNGKIEPHPIWKATPMEFSSILCLLYLITEGKLIQRVLLAFKVKQENTSAEYAIIDQSASGVDKSILDKFKR
jgi:hypothetical protein